MNAAQAQEAVQAGGDPLGRGGAGDRARQSGHGAGADGQKQAALDTAQVNLDHTYIRAPVDGTVVLRNVDVGQTVVASLQSPLIFTIAQDLGHMQVDARSMRRMSAA